MKKLIVNRKKKRKYKLFALFLSLFGTLSYIYTYEDDNKKAIIHYTFQLLSAFIIMLIFAISGISVVINLIFIFFVINIIFQILIIIDVLHRPIDYYRKYFVIKNNKRIYLNGKNQYIIEKKNDEKQKKNKNTALMLVIFYGISGYIYTYEDHYKDIIKYILIFIFLIIFTLSLIIPISLNLSDTITGYFTLLFVLMSFNSMIIFIGMRLYLIYLILKEPEQYYKDYFNSYVRDN